MLLPNKFCSWCPPGPKARQGAGGGSSSGRRVRPFFRPRASSVRRGVARWSDAVRGACVDGLSVRTLAGARGRPCAWTPGPGDRVRPSVRRPSRACPRGGRLRGLPWSSEAPASGLPTRGRISPFVWPRLRRRWMVVPRPNQKRSLLPAKIDHVLPRSRRPPAPARAPLIVICICVLAGGGVL